MQSIIKTFSKENLYMQNIIVSANPYEELLKFSADTGKDYASLDFAILGFSTNCDINGESKNFSEKELVFFDDDENFLNETLKINQNYKFQIKDLDENSKKLNDSVKIELNKDGTTLILKLSLQDLEYHNSLAMDILQTVYKKMIKEGFFLSIRIFDFKKKLIYFLHNFKEKKIHKKNVIIQICKGVKTISAEDEKLILSYQDKIRQKYGANKVGIIGVKKSELVFKHIKPGTSKRGRSLKLEFIEPRALKENKIEVSFSENYEEKQVADKKGKSNTSEYFAKKSGFVSHTGGRYDIESELTLSSVNFKDTGAIYAGLDTGVTLNLRSLSDLEEAVGSGVNIECENININGNVAGNTVIKAKNLKIYGQTHSKSSLYAENAYISMHKGRLEAKVADLDSIENAFVKADIVKLKKSLGSNIEAKKVYFLSMSSNNNINLSQVAVIDHIEGSNNKFLVSIEKTEVDFEQRLREINQRQEKLPSLIASLQNNMDASRGGVETIIKQIEILKSQGQKIPVNFFQIVKDYQNYLKELKSLNKEEASLKIEEAELLEKIKEAQKTLFDAKIINKEGKWSDMNEIKFKFIHPKNEVLYSTRSSDSAKLFILHKDVNDGGKLKIEAKNEFNEEDTKW